jgi:hypothetical protein
MERTSQTPAEALEVTDRSLRRVLRHLKDAELEGEDDLQKEIARARRQLRANRELLRDEE